MRLNRLIARIDLRNWQYRFGVGKRRADGSLLPFVLTIGMLSVATLLHYGDMLPVLSAVADKSPIGLSPRQSFERILILVPIAYATFALGGRAGVAAGLAAFAVLFPRAVMSSGHIDHALFEMAGVMVVGALLVVAVTQQIREVETQERVRDGLRYFVGQVLTSQEDERKRIAMELHDDTAQSLLLSCQRLDRLVVDEGSGLSVEALTDLNDLRAETVRTLTDLRRLTQHLRPSVFDDQGLVPALEWLADSLSDQYGIMARVQVTGDLQDGSPETQLLLFRIAQEAMRNVGRHSGATEAVVTLHSRRERATMTVEDNGRGFRVPGSPSELGKMGKLGLLGMDERARLVGGSLDIRSSPGSGTTISVELPWIKRGAVQPRDENQITPRWPAWARTFVN
jgi:two-component system sensor histidine kinase DegS